MLMKNSLFVLLFISLGMITHDASARMYQWVDQENQTTQLSGKPPVWYRSVDGGPRVLVFDRGEVIDDTGIAVSDGVRERLRQNAFIRAEEDRVAARQKLLDAKRLKAAFDQNVDSNESESDQENVEVQSDLPETESTTPVAENSVVEEMRSMIREWERRRTENAKALVE